MDLENLRRIAEKYIAGTATEEEEELLHAYYNNLNNEEPETVLNEHHNDAQAFGREMLAELLAKIQSEKTIPVLSPVRRMAKYWKAAAAAIILFVSVYFYFTFNNKKQLISETAKSSDILPPASNRATITLGNGQRIYFDSIGSGTLAKQGTVDLVKSATGDLIYQTGNQPATTQVIYNTLSNPFGSKVTSIKLSDGTRVWLNAGSSLTYPVAFTAHERKVSINGEAYFEVAENKEMPFTVAKNKMEIQVLGTHFNVNAYDDESNIDVTLLEGKVKVNYDNNARTLAPGQQARVNQKGDILFNDAADIDQTIAWKNGLFSCKSCDIQTIMRQVSRWYNITVEYNGRPTDKFHVEMDRNTNVSNVFKILEATGGVHFIINQNKIIVMP